MGKWRRRRRGKGRGGAGGGESSSADLHGVVAEFLFRAAHALRRQLHSLNQRGGGALRVSYQRLEVAYHKQDANNNSVSEVASEIGGKETRQNAGSASASENVVVRPHVCLSLPHAFMSRFRLGP